MKKHLRSVVIAAGLILSIALMAAQIVNGNLYVTPYGGYGGRTGINVDPASATYQGTSYALNVRPGTGNNGVKFQARVSTPFGTNKASANNLTFDSTATGYQITGTTTINLIDTTGWNDGDEITLFFNGSLTVTDSSAASTKYAPINLASGSNLSATKNDCLVLVKRREVGKLAAEWWQKSLTVNAD